jgi:hypothetical protein
MARKAKTDLTAYTYEQREQQLIDLTLDVAEQQLRDGTASPSVITHFLKLATEEHRIRSIMLREQMEYIKTKADKVRSDANQVQDYENMLNALRDYGYGNNLC